MKDAGEVGIKSIAIIGDGEPTCNPHFYEALEVGKNSGLSLSTSTNGVLIDTNEKRDTILRNCEWMRFCISAGTKEGYKIVHNVDKFDVVKRNIADMVNLRDKKRYGCEIGLQAVFVPTVMAQEMDEEAKLAVELGVNYFVIKQCSLPDTTGKSRMMKFDLNDYDKPEILEALQKAEDRSTKKTKIIPKWNLIAQKGQKPYHRCPSIPFISEISGNGDWYPCGYMFGGKPEFDKYKFGNVHEKRLKEILKSDRYWDIVKTMREDFNVQTQCHGACRQDKCNEFCDLYQNPPKGVNFI